MFLYVIEEIGPNIHGNDCIIYQRKIVKINFLTVNIAVIILT